MPNDSGFEKMLLIIWYNLAYLVRPRLTMTRIHMWSLHLRKRKLNDIFHFLPTSIKQSRLRHYDVASNTSTFDIYGKYEKIGSWKLLDVTNRNTPGPLVAFLSLLIITQPLQEEILESYTLHSAVHVICYVHVQNIMPLHI